MAEAPKKKKFKLSTPTEVRRALSKVANMVMNKECTSDQAKTFNSICNTILNSLRTDEQQRAIEELERMVAELEARQNEN